MLIYMLRGSAPVPFKDSLSLGTVEAVVQVVFLSPSQLNHKSRMSLE